MNSLRAEALPVKRKWRRSFVSSVVLLLVGLPLFASTPKTVASRKGLAVQSDAVPLDIQPRAVDLQLSPEEQRKGDAMAMFVTALIDEDNAETDKAFEEYQKTINLDPGYTELAVKVAYELARRGDAAGGINVLKDSIKASPKQPAAYLCLSQLYAKYLNKPELAIHYATQALDLSPQELAPYLVLYELYADGHREKNAKLILERAMKQESTSPDYWFQLGEFLAGHLMKEPASELADDLKKLTVIFQKSLSFAGDDTALITRIADYFLLLKQPKEAVSLYTKVISLKGKANDPEMTSVRDKLARSLAANGQFDEAVALLKQLIKENSLRYEDYGLLGEIYEQKGDLQNALINYQQALLLNPSQPSNYMRVADMELKTRQFEPAIKLLAEARKKFSELPEITYSLAVAQSQANRHQEAIATFEEALHEAQATQPEMLNSAFYFAYGSTAEQGGMTDRAVELLKKSIEIDPAHSAQACNYLGYMWVDRGEHLDEAAGLIKRALELDPENPAFLDSLGWYYFKTANYEKALTELQKAAAGIQPEDATIYEHLGDTYLKLNNTAQALVYWQKAARIDPANKGILLKIEDSKQKVSANPTPAAK